MGVFDLLFLLLVVWWIFRAMGGGRAPEDEDRPGRPAPDRRPGSAGREGDGESEWRRRLREAVQEWELEQRRRSGDAVPETEARHTGTRSEPSGMPSGESGPEAAHRPDLSYPFPSRADRAPPEDGRGAGTRFQDVRDVTAGPREGLGPEIGEAPKRRSRRRLAAARHHAGPGRRERVPSGTLGAGPGLPGFERRSHLQRAILYMEILGPPRSVSDRPWHEYRS